ncbi:armadillo/beta-catenin-like repeat-containing protein [Xylona heveae TC161]|uniref:Armadillo/beta-catenin-like repeat-containing protein n=1 Tax=Xylona heveae (strain CBS 132557 / TC161) TaxID=1328760 RepID=A0A165I9I7_XYLHT|nr:armadillo/beta-catenin-like repeat-containing protein [Xylona heveae TC161]KZF24585.1 armadillo/beta-catenin-like repeat-containing protein [Xylona heveae TC161]
MTDPGLNSLLKWGVEHSKDTPSSNSNNNTTSTGDAARGIDPQALAQLLGGPSDADLMKDAMAAIVSPNVDLENKLIAFDNYEQLIETIDNANNQEPLGLWTPLLGQLENAEPEMRKMAAWCVGTAVQNNPKAQERVLILGGVPTLVRIAVGDANEQVRRKAIYALSSAVRNYQPALDEAGKHLPAEIVAAADGPEKKKLDAADMDQIDRVMQALREASQAKQASS